MLETLYSDIYRFQFIYYSMTWPGCMLSYYIFRILVSHIQFDYVKLQRSIEH